MSGPGESSSGAIGLLAVLGALAAAAVWADRQRAAGPKEVALHQAALNAVEQARAQIHDARRAADALRQFSVDFDVQAKLASAFTEDLPSQVNPTASKTDWRKLLFVVDSADRLPALKQTVDNLLARPGGAGASGDEPASTRAALRQAIDTQGGTWTAERALAVLEGRGWHSDSERPLNVVGNLLAAMFRDNEIQRTGRGQYGPLHPPAGADTSYNLAPGLIAKEASPGVLVISGIEPVNEIPEAA
jgi:hypothetical protein